MNLKMPQVKIWRKVLKLKKIILMRQVECFFILCTTVEHTLPQNELRTFSSYSKVNKF